MPSELQDDGLSADSDDVPADLDDDSNEEVEDDDDDDSATGDEEDDEVQDDEDALSLVEASDAEDLISLDADIPGGLIEYDGTDSEAGDVEEWGGIGGPVTKKRKHGGEEDKKTRKKIRSLPTFASYEDYAKIIEDGPEDYI